MHEGDSLAIVIFVVLISLVLGLNYLASRKARQLIHGWADACGYRILNLEFRWFRRGPFFWTSGKGQLVYYVVLMDQDQRRQAFVRCGSFWLGMLSDNMDVRWER